LPAIPKNSKIVLASKIIFSRQMSIVSAKFLWKSLCLKYCCPSFHEVMKMIEGQVTFSWSHVRMLSYLDNYVSGNMTHSVYDMGSWN
jgi:hypothetical protein